MDGVVPGAREDRKFAAKPAANSLRERVAMVHLLEQRLLTTMLQYYASDPEWKRQRPWVPADQRHDGYQPVVAQSHFGVGHARKW